VVSIALGKYLVGWKVERVILVVDVVTVLWRVLGAAERKTVLQANSARHIVTTDCAFAVSSVLYESRIAFESNRCVCAVCHAW
jgi:hypothetical protein